eukprot:40156_1
MSHFTYLNLISLLIFHQITTADIPNPLKTYTSEETEIPMHLALTIDTTTTELRIESELPNNQVWFGVSFNATSMSSNTYGVVYNPTYPTLIHDIYLNSQNTPTLLQSEWTIEQHIFRPNGQVLITLSRPNEILSHPNYANFNTLKQTDTINAIWAHGTSNSFTDHGKFRTASILSCPKLPTISPSLSPTLKPTLCTPPDGSPHHCIRYQQKKHKPCCLADPECKWDSELDGGYCDEEGGGPDCCIERTRLPTKTPITPWPTNHPVTDPTTPPTIIPTEIPTVTPTQIPTKYPTEYPTKFPTTFPSKYPTTFPTEMPTIRVPLVAEVTDQPTSTPTDRPTPKPTPKPTRKPTHKPTNKPTHKPTHKPTITSNAPTIRPTNPSHIPTNTPTISPTL